MEEFSNYDSKYQDYVLNRAYWVHLDKKNELKHFYRVVGCDIGVDTTTKEWQLWFSLQMDKDDKDWIEWYRAERLSVDRRTYLMCLRYLG